MTAPYDTPTDVIPAITDDTPRPAELSAEAPAEPEVPEVPEGPAEPEAPAEPAPVDPKLDARRRRIRTAFQSGLSACTVLLVIVPLVLHYLETAVPPKVYAVLAGGAAAIVTGATVATRVMTHPAVVQWIDRFLPWLSADPEVGSK